MSNHTSPPNLRTVRIPEKFILHWIKEGIRLHGLCEVLFRSLCYSDTGEKSYPRGDEALVEHIKDSLDRLWIEIEEVKDGHWEPRRWEVEENE